jgi:hypothetical protein
VGSRLSSTCCRRVWGFRVCVKRQQSLSVALDVRRVYKSSVLFSQKASTSSILFASHRLRKILPNRIVLMTSGSYASCQWPARAGDHSDQRFAFAHTRSRVWISSCFFSCGLLPPQSFRICRWASFALALSKETNNCNSHVGIKPSAPTASLDIASGRTLLLTSFTQQTIYVELTKSKSATSLCPFARPYF